MLDKIKGFATIIFVLTIMVLGGYTKTKEMEKKEVKNHDTVEETIYDKYFSKTGHDKDYYEIKTYYKDGKLQYVTVYYTGCIEIKEREDYRITYAVEVFDNDLNRVKGFGAYDYEEVWKEAYNVIEGL